MSFIRTNLLLAEFHQKNILSLISYTAKKVHFLSRHRIEEDGRQTITSCKTAFWMLWLTPWKQQAVDGRCRTPWPFDYVMEMPNTPVLLLPPSNKGPARLSSQSGILCVVSKSVCQESFGGLSCCYRRGVIKWCWFHETPQSKFVSKCETTSNHSTATPPEIFRAAAAGWR